MTVYVAAGSVVGLHRCGLKRTGSKDMFCARVAPVALTPGGSSPMRLMLRLAGRAAASTVAHRSRRLARERERQLKKVVTTLSHDEVARLQRLLRRRVQQEALLEGASAVELIRAQVAA